MNTIGGTDTITLVLDNAPTGVAGYAINVTIDNPAIARITAVSFPSWADLNSASTLPSSYCLMGVTDLNGEQGPGTGITLATLTIEGLSGGQSTVHANVILLNGDDESEIWPTVTEGTFTVDVPVAPVAVFTTNVTSGTAPLDMQFTDHSTGSPTSWSWSR